MLVKQELSLVCCISYMIVMHEGKGIVMHEGKGATGTRPTLQRSF